MRNSKKVLKIKKILYPLKRLYILAQLISVSDLYKVLFLSKTESANSIKIKPLRGAEILIRGNSLTDRKVLIYVFYHRYHLPPYQLKNKPVIVDLGSNIGLTLRHFSFLYPDAKILGFEMDKNNFGLCWNNCKGCHNVMVYNQAIWIYNGYVSYNPISNQDAYHIDNQTHQSDVSVESITIPEIIHRYHLTSIDYLKMDIEGAEKNIFQNDLEWTNHVRLMNIEIHDRAFISETIRLLTNRGFTCWYHPSHSFSIYASKNPASL